MSFEALIARANAIRDARDSDRYHGPKDVARGIATEAAELLPHFRFLSEEQTHAALADAPGREAVENELADVPFFVLRFAQHLGVDPAGVLNRKLAKNAARYPVKKARGRNAKYTEL